MHGTHGGGDGPVTVHDVAVAAGVSRQTVSNVVNAPERVSPATRQRVQAVIDELGYQPNRAARALRAHASRLIGYRIRPNRPDALAAILDRFLHAFAEAARDLDHHLLLFAAAEADEVAACDRLLRSGAVDGFVLTDLDYRDRRPAAMAALDAPFASFGRTGDEFVWVDVDNAAGTERATEHLVAAGHRRIGYVGVPAGDRIGDDRESGWRTAMRRHGLDEGFARHAADSIEAGAQAGGELLDTADPPTAIVAATDVFAVGVLRAAGQRGLRVGPDLAVCGFDDTPTADVLGLTSVRQPVEEVARAMMAVLAPRLPGAPADLPRPPATRLFVPELVVRGSTG
ncbi:substrate-binding domain-containing protein [Actinocatenispora sera]|uniref:LacI family DNA-binding transcriptional regulator n=1 Tax=Actinocatenispora sera TaxID=390989 RepID=UPI0033DF644B